jgi:hypothetical protein
MAGFGGWLRGLVGKEEPAPSLLHAGTRTGGPRSFAEEGHDFALAMYRQLQQRPGNLFFSPFSIRTALGLIQAGARGETAAQMREALLYFVLGRHAACRLHRHRPAAQHSWR